MRNIYISVILFVALAAALLAGSFIYLDRANRKTFHYIIQEGDHTVGTIRIDRFMTEDKIIYRSVRATPLEPYYTEQRTRLVVDKRYTLES